MRFSVFAKERYFLNARMSAKQIRLLLIIFIVLVALLAAKIYLPGLRPPKSTYLQKMKSLRKETVQRIDVAKGSDKAELTKDQNVWKVNGKKADEAKILAILTAILPEIGPETIAQTEAKYSEFELTDELATKITLDNAAPIFMGKYSMSGVYVRIEGSPEVYLLKGASTFSAKASDWYDLTVVAIDRTMITKLTFIAGATTQTVVKKDDLWVRESDSKEIQKDTVESILLALASLRAQSLYDSQSSTGYPKQPTSTLIIEYSGKSETLEFYKGTLDYLVKRQSDQEQFVAGEYSVTSLVSIPQTL